MRDFESLRPPPPKLGDIINTAHMLPDIFHVYTTRLYLELYEQFDLREKIGKLPFMVACFSIQTMMLVLIIRCFPRIIGIPLMLALTIVSVMNSCGMLLLLYLVFDTGRWLILGARTVSAYTAPVSETRKEAWWTKELNGLIMLLVVMSVGGCYFGFFRTEVMYVCYMVVVILTFSTAFPTNGQNAGINSLLIMAASMIIILFVTGAGERLLGVLGDYARRSSQERRERVVVQETTTDAWTELMYALGDWQSSIFLSTFALDITKPADCLRYVFGSTYLITLVLGNLLGPTSCIKAAALLQYKATDKSKVPDGLNSIFNSRWNNAVIFTVVATAIRGTWFCTLLSAMGAGLAWLYFWYIERRTWAGVGEFVSVKSGREDADMVVGEGPGALREFAIKVMIAVLTLAHPNIHPLVMMVMGAFLYMSDHRVLCFMAAILTQNYGFLVGTFCVSSKTLVDDLKSKAAPAYSGGDVDHGRNSKRTTLTELWQSAVGKMGGVMTDWLPKDDEYWSQTVVKNDDKPP